MFYYLHPSNIILRLIIFLPETVAELLEVFCFVQQSCTTFLFFFLFGHCLNLVLYIVTTCICDVHSTVPCQTQICVAEKAERCRYLFGTEPRYWWLARILWHHMIIYLPLLSSVTFHFDAAEKWHLLPAGVPENVTLGAHKYTNTLVLSLHISSTAQC